MYPIVVLVLLQRNQTLIMALFPLALYIVASTNILHVCHCSSCHFESWRRWTIVSSSFFSNTEASVGSFCQHRRPIQLQNHTHLRASQDTERLTHALWTFLPQNVTAPAKTLSLWRVILAAPLTRRPSNIERIASLTTYHSISVSGLCAMAYSVSKLPHS